MVQRLHRVLCDAAAPNLGNLTFGAAVAGHQTPAAAGAADGVDGYWIITDGTDWEVVKGQLSGSATVLSRDTVIESTNAGAKVDFTAAVTVANTLTPEQILEIDDTASTGADKTWSITKIAAEVAAAGQAGATTPAPQLSATTHAGNESTTVDVTIQNYNAVDNTYTVTSDDEALVTVSRSGATITLTLVDVQWSDEVATSGQATVTVSAYDAANYSFAGTTDIVVTVNRVTVADATIQVTDFSSALGASTDVTIESNKPVADADGAELTSINFTQEGGEENWTKATPTLALKGKDLASLGSLDAAGLKFYTADAGLLASTAMSVWDDSDTLKSYTAAPTAAPSIASSSARAWTDNGAALAPEWLIAEEDNLVQLLAINHSSNGKYACAYFRRSGSSNYRWAICELDVPYSTLGTGTVLSNISLIVTVPPNLNLTINASHYGGPFVISNDGSKLYVRFSYNAGATYAWVAEYTLSTAYDLTTMGSGFAIDQNPYSTSYDYSDYCANIYLSADEQQIITSAGNNYRVAAFITYIHMATPLDLSSQDVESLLASGSTYVWASFQVSPAEDALLVTYRYDDNGGLYRTYKWDFTAGDFSTIDDSASVAAMNTWSGTATFGCIVYDPVKNHIFACDAYNSMTSGYGRDLVTEDAGAHFYAPPDSVTLTGPAISGTVDFIGASDLSTPVLNMDVADTEGALDLNGTALTINTDTGWSFDGTDLVRDITYVEQAVFGDNLKFKVSAMDKGLIIDSMTIPLERDQ